MKGITIMEEIKRLYVEKKPGCDVEAQHLLEDLKENIGVTGLTSLRILQRYDMEGISEKDYQSAKNTIFSEPPVDYVYEDAPFSAGEHVFATEYLPGQYDQRADSAIQCVQLISQAEKPTIAVAKVFALKGEISVEELQKIKNYCINPVDSREASLEKPNSLQLKTDIPEDVKDFEGFIEKNPKELEKLRQELSTAMSQEDFIFCQQYFRDTEKRNPSVTEIRVIDTYWSDHCRHTTFQTKIENVAIEDGKYKAPFQKAYELYQAERKEVYGEKETQRDVTLMDIAVLGMKALRKKGLLDNLDQSEEINA